MIDINQAVSIARRDTEIHEAQLMGIANRKGFGVIAECKHCTEDDRAKQCEFHCRTFVYFHVAVEQSNRCANGKNGLNDCHKS